MTFSDEPYTLAEKLVIDQVRLDVSSLDRHHEGVKPPRTIVYREQDHYHVELSKQGLTRLPLAILHQIEKHVDRLNLSENRLAENALPPRIARAEKLYYLKLSSCKLREIPSGVFTNQTLAVLDISNNELSELDRRLARLIGLRALNAPHNRITSLPGWLLHLNLIHLQLTGNPIEDAPPEVWDTSYPTNEGKKAEQVTSDILIWLSRHKAHEADDASLTLRLPGQTPPFSKTKLEKDQSLLRPGIAAQPLAISKSSSSSDSSFPVANTPSSQMQPSVPLSDLSLASAAAAANRRPSTSRSDRNFSPAGSAVPLVNSHTSASTVKSNAKYAHVLPAQDFVPLLNARPQITRTATSIRTTPSPAPTKLPATDILNHVASLAAATLRFAAHTTMEFSLCLQLGDIFQPGVSSGLLDTLHALHLCSEELMRSIQNVDGSITDRQDFLNAVIGNYVYPMEMLKAEALNEIQNLISTTNTLSSRAIGAFMKIISAYNIDIKKAHSKTGMDLAENGGTLSLVLQGAQGKEWTLMLRDHANNFNIYSDVIKGDATEDFSKYGLPSPLIIALQRLLEAVTEHIKIIRISLSEYAQSNTMQAGKPSLKNDFNGATTRIQEVEDTSATLASCLRFDQPDLNTLLASGEELCSSLYGLIAHLVPLIQSNENISQKIKPVAKALRQYTRQAFAQIEAHREVAANPGGASESANLATPGSATPATPMYVAIGGQAARLVAKDTAGVFKRIDELQNKVRKKY